MKKALHNKYPLSKVLLAYIIIIAFTLVVSLASIWTFTFTLAPRFKGLTSAFLFLIIPLLYFGVYLYANSKIKKAYPFVNEKMKKQTESSMGRGGIR